MQYTVWRFSPKARTLIEFIVTFIFCCISFIYIDSFFVNIPKVQEYELQLFDLEARLEAIRLEEERQEAFEVHVIHQLKL